MLNILITNYCQPSVGSETPELELWGKRETVRVIAVDCHVKTDSVLISFSTLSVWYSENLSEMLTWLGIFYIRKRDLFDSPMKIKICFKLAFFSVTWGHPSGVKRTWEIKLSR